MKRILPVVVLTLLVAMGCLLATSRAQTPAFSDQPLNEGVSDKAKLPANPSDVDVPQFKRSPRLPPVRSHQLPMNDPEEQNNKAALSFEELPAGSQPKNVTMRRVRRVRTVVEETLEPVPKEEVAEAEAIKKLEPRLKLADGDKLKEAAIVELENLLKKAFDRDLDRREKEIADVENRVSRLRDQIKKRFANKEAIVKLRLQTMVNDAAGLGFPSPYDELQPRPSDPSPTIEWRYPSDYYRPRSVETPLGAPPVPSRKKPVLDPELPRKLDKSGDQKATERPFDS